MIYRLIIGLLLLATAIYYIFCFLEIFGVIKFTDKNTTVRIPQMFIPFYYLIHSDKLKQEKAMQNLSLRIKEPASKRRVKPIKMKES